MVEGDLALENVRSLTVVQLRCELEKRGLEKSGLRTSLVVRLETHIQEAAELEAALAASRVENLGDKGTATSEQNTTLKSEAQGKEDGGSIETTKDQDKSSLSLSTHLDEAGKTPANDNSSSGDNALTSDMPPGGTVKAKNKIEKAKDEEKGKDCAKTPSKDRSNDGKELERENCDFSKGEMKQHGKNTPDKSLKDKVT